LPVEIDIASELRYRDVPYAENGGALFVSQSGETADTLAALRDARANGQMIAAVVNVPESSIAREADVIFPMAAGPEIGVASTKAFTCQLAALACVAAAAGRARGVLSEAEEQDIVKALLQTPRLVSEALKQHDAIENVAREIAKSSDILYVGRGVSFPLAMEGALKLKEISYIHAEGYAAGELKHGPIALIDENMPIVVIAPSDRHFEKTVSNMQEMMAREGKALLISDADGLARAGADAWMRIEAPPTHPLLSPIVYAAPIQLLAYYTATTKGTDVDQPRNLAKSVTVE
ncbi:MAG: isomerizing glutamine--fructose-6-phosphate transaminase, partial [Parvularculaceae bacterium]|nr:isomerizing glutamine--fructose-6-phosphate transaminase [Parvularculaceae bacterium]